MARDLIALTTERPPDSFEVKVIYLEETAEKYAARIEAEEEALDVASTAK